jgi:hypothetical protein
MGKNVFDLTIPELIGCLIAAGVIVAIGAWLNG